MKSQKAAAAAAAYLDRLKQIGHPAASLDQHFTATSQKASF
jgi:hypothetical protein